MENSNLLKLFKKTKVFLIGDIMLDKYVFGKINRISPEAPVPVFLTETSKKVLGGSGNVLSNLVSLGVDTNFLSVIGKDNTGNEIRKLLRKLSLKNYKLILETQRRTTIKTRYISNSQQIIRVDEESSEDILKKTEEVLIKEIDGLIKNKDVVIISDYNKGVISKRLCEYIIKKANSYKIPTIIDPKNENFSIYKNATLITPNQLEASKVARMDFTNDKETEIAGKKIINNYHIKNILITRGDQGLSLISKNKSLHAPTTTKEVFDVSGAGDTVLAIVAACYPNKIKEEDVLDLANKAAGKVIAKIGTNPITPEELFGSSINFPKNKIIDIKKLSKKINIDKKNGLKIGFTNGCFDILHYGHVQYLENSKNHCDKLIVALNSDKSVKLLKGKTRPVNNEFYRAKIIASLQFCDYVIIFNEKTPLSIIKKIKPDLITKGGDYKNKSIVGENEIKKWGGIVLTLKFLKGFSSSRLIDKLGI